MSQAISYIKKVYNLADLTSAVSTATSGSAFKIVLAEGESIEYDGITYVNGDFVFYNQDSNELIRFSVDPNEYALLSSLTALSNKLDELKSTITSDYATTSSINSAFKNIQAWIKEWFDTTIDGSSVMVQSGDTGGYLVDKVAMGYGIITTVTGSEGNYKLKISIDPTTIKLPYIDTTTNHWMVYNTETLSYEDSGVNSVGATGPQGADGKDGIDGKDGADGKDGEDAASITSVTQDEPISTESGAQNSVSINLSNGTQSKFYVYNGAQGDQGATGDRGPQGNDGENGEGFHFAKLYSSVDEMNADYNNEDINIGDFVLIDTGNVEDPDNSKMYVKGLTKYDFVTDLSGAQGIQGTGIQSVIQTKSPTGSGAQIGFQFIYTNGEQSQEIFIYNGKQGNGISSIDQTKTSTVSGGQNGIQVTYTNGTQSSEFLFYNGKQGATGDQGTSVTGITKTSTSKESGGQNGFQLNLSNGSKSSEVFVYNGAQGDQGSVGETGNGISSIDQVRSSTASGGQCGIQATYTDGTQSSEFPFYNGAQGPQGKQGKQGKTGISISSIDQTTTSTESSGKNGIQATYSDGSQSAEFEFYNGAQGAQGDTGPQGDEGDITKLLYVIEGTVTELPTEIGTPVSLDAFTHNGSVIVATDIKIDGSVLPILKLELPASGSYETETETVIVNVSDKNYHYASAGVTEVYFDFINKGNAYRVIVQRVAFPKGGNSDSYYIYLINENKISISTTAGTSANVVYLV